MSECPIGLICSDFECDRRIRRTLCFNLAKPWPLPYCCFVIDPEWRENNGFLVEMPSYAEHDSCKEEDIEDTERYNHWVESVRHGFYEGGWWEAIKLPYKSLIDGGLIVVKRLNLDASVTFATPYNFDNNGRYLYRHFKGFEPPVPIHGYQKIYGKLSTEFSDEDYPEGERPLEDYPLLYFWHFVGFEQELSELYIQDTGRSIRWL
ncbi:hypothetical protein CDG76_30610 [Nostoc sp. 'Peltigera membranacea cyanobiont' 210A]|uniref:hypothetical protein n=1 Tax=Nostoc sp. 'Peltigera membranacea cyanobiont' 210A TaxID=2014529 RepID=UPI000B951CD3|nr:hypothetical protein [Nostoc sp. 'Peltigera membranacea cyanobiont' 210A]OYD90578.1 hypothetical protein CDG76_30610 [Nostoc sp. 'Peltigera membranacea cyanobiont' 210A]